MIHDPVKYGCTTEPSKTTTDDTDELSFHIEIIPSKYPHDPLDHGGMIHPLAKTVGFEPTDRLAAINRFRIGLVITTSLRLT